MAFHLVPISKGGHDVTPAQFGISGLNPVIQGIARNDEDNSRLTWVKSRAPNGDPFDEVFVDALEKQLRISLDRQQTIWWTPNDSFSDALIIQMSRVIQAGMDCLAGIAHFPASTKPSVVAAMRPADTTRLLQRKKLLQNIAIVGSLVALGAIMTTALLRQLQ